MTENTGSSSSTHNSETETGVLLAGWSAEVCAALGLEGLAVDIDGVLALAGVAARAVVRPAAPLTTFLAGYAAGVAAAGGAEAAAAMESSVGTARRLAAMRVSSDSE